MEALMAGAYPRGKNWTCVIDKSGRKPRLALLSWCLYATQSASKLNRALSMDIFYSKVVKESRQYAAGRLQYTGVKQIHEVNPTRDLDGWHG